MKQFSFWNPRDHWQAQPRLPHAVCLGKVISAQVRLYKLSDGPVNTSWVSRGSPHFWLSFGPADSFSVIRLQPSSLCVCLSQFSLDKFVIPCFERVIHGPWSWTLGTPFHDADSTPRPIRERPEVDMSGQGGGQQCPPPCSVWLSWAFLSLRPHSHLAVKAS